jgi:DNA-binding SARP family transcriptional activator
MLVFSILGPLMIRSCGREITPTAPKVRQMISLLLVRRNQVVQVSEIIDELWANNPPPSAMTTLQTYIYKLRKDVLEPSGLAQLVTQPSGYLLEVADDTVDASSFERLTAEGRQALGRNDFRHAADLLSRALAHWRGQALTGVRAGEILSGHVIRLEEIRLRALEMRIDAEMRLGRHQDLIGELKQLALTYPLHEGFHRDLMTALELSGRRFDALDVFRQLRTTLINELGLEPSAQLQELHQGLLSTGASAAGQGAGQGSAPVLDRSAGPQPRALVRQLATAPGTPRHAPQPVPRKVNRADQPLGGWHTPEPVPAQLPADIPDFVGRVELVFQIRRWLAMAVDNSHGRPVARALAVLGAAGLGKTTLTVHAAHLEKSRFPDGQFFGDLRGSSPKPADPGEVLHGFLNAARIRPQDIPQRIEDRSRLFRTWCRGRRVLIVLDDARSYAQAAQLIPATPHSVVLISSRGTADGHSGVMVSELRPMTPDEGLALLSQVVGADRVAAEPAAARAVVELCGRLPLAIRSVGANLASIPGCSIRKVAAQLEADAVPLAEFQHDGHDLRDRYEGSYQSLEPNDRSTLRLLSLLPPGPFSGGTAADLLGVSPNDVTRRLNRLVDCRLLKSTTATGATSDACYELDRLCRLYAQERLSTEYLQPQVQRGGSGARTPLQNSGGRTPSAASG